MHRVERLTWIRKPIPESLTHRRIDDAFDEFRRKNFAPFRLVVQQDGDPAAIDDDQSVLPVPVRPLKNLQCVSDDRFQVFSRMPLGDLGVHSHGERSRGFTRRRLRLWWLAGDVIPNMDSLQLSQDGERLRPVVHEQGVIVEPVVDGPFRKPSINSGAGFGSAAFT